jgi:hypothetical protein
MPRGQPRAAARTGRGGRTAIGTGCAVSPGSLVAAGSAGKGLTKRETGDHGRPRKRALHAHRAAHMAHTAPPPPLPPLTPRTCKDVPPSSAPGRCPAPRRCHAFPRPRLRPGDARRLLPSSLLPACDPNAPRALGHHATRGARFFGTRAAARGFHHHAGMAPQAKSGRRSVARLAAETAKTSAKVVPAGEEEFIEVRDAACPIRRFAARSVRRLRQNSAPGRPPAHGRGHVGGCGSRKGALHQDPPAPRTPAQFDLEKPLGYKYARGNDGRAYIVAVDPNLGNVDPRVQVRAWSPGARCKHPAGTTKLAARPPGPNRSSLAHALRLHQTKTRLLAAPSRRSHIRPPPSAARRQDHKDLRLLRRGDLGRSELRAGAQAQPALRLH